VRSSFPVKGIEGSRNLLASEISVNKISMAVFAAQCIQKIGLVVHDFV
jgi:hypothetical protein